MKFYRIAQTILGGSALVFAACGGDQELEETAKQVCAEIRKAPSSQAISIISNGLPDAREFTEYMDALDKECPSLIISAGQSELSSQMHLNVETCSNDKMSGTIQNNSSVTVDIYIDAHFLGEDNHVLGDNIDSVRGLQPGEIANWSTPFIDVDTEWVKRCRAEVSSVFER